MVVSPSTSQVAAGRPGGRNADHPSSVPGLATLLQVVATRLGGDREAGGHREAQAGHLRQVRRLAAEQVLLVLITLAEVVDELLHLRSFPAPAGISSVSSSCARFTVCTPPC